MFVKMFDHFIFQCLVNFSVPKGFCGSGEFWLACWYGMTCSVVSLRVRNVGAKFELDIQNPCSSGGVFLPFVVEMQY